MTHDSLYSRLRKYVYHPHYGLLRTLRDPDVLRGHVRMRLLKKLNNAIGEHRYAGTGESVMEQDWDTLILLDVCRYDTFKKLINREGQLARRRSIAPETTRFIQRTFDGKQFHDTVYVSGNPKVPALTAKDTLHAVIPVWQHKWDEGVGSVRPETVTKYVKEAAQDYPNKRMIIHYIQPHQPFVGSRGREFIQKHELRGINEFTDETTQLKLYHAMRYGLLDVTDETLRDLYQENLEVALESVGEFVDGIEGKTVITSDHGELLGDVVGVFPMKGYGHPTPLHVSKLLEVPWFELPFDSRRSIAEDPPERTDSVDMEVVDKRLDAFGYMDSYE